MPDLANDENVKIFQGSLDDEELLARCLSGTRAAFLAVALTGNPPGCSIAQDTAHQTFAAFENLKSKHERLPKLIVLSSACTDHRLMSEKLPLLLSILYFALRFKYDDLKEAERFIRSKDSLVSATFIKPGALTNDSQKGHIVSLDQSYGPLSYLDLAAGMVEVADDGSGRYDMKGVAINPTAKDVAFPWGAPLALLKGLIVSLMPWTYKYIG